LQAKYDAWLEGCGVPTGEHPLYRKWLLFCLDSCRKYGHGYAAAASLEPFLAKLASKVQTQEQLEQAAAAVTAYHHIARDALRARVKEFAALEPRAEGKPSRQVPARPPISRPADAAWVAPDAQRP